MANKVAYYLAYTDNRFVAAGKSYPDVPLLVDRQHQFVEPVCEYLRHLAVDRNLRSTSLKTYAEQLLHFWTYIGGLPFDSVTDRTLVAWKNTQKLARIKDKTLALRFTVVFDFFVWAQMNAHVQDMIKIPGVNDDVAFTPLLSSDIASQPRQGWRRSKRGIVSSVRPRLVDDERQPTPNREEISKLYIAADQSSNRPLVERNHLLLSWYVRVGLRRVEWASLTVDQIPDWKEIYRLQERCHSFELRLKFTKGGKVRHVAVLPDLLEATREYIEGTRAALVARFKTKCKQGEYQEPREIFLSNKTGERLNLTAISNILTSLFDSAKVDGHGHRLRASNLTQLVEAKIQEEEARRAAFSDSRLPLDTDRILREVAERAGHANIDSLRPYVTGAQKRIIREIWSKDPTTLQQKVEAKIQELKILEHRIALADAALRSQLNSSSEE